MVLFSPDVQGARCSEARPTHPAPVPHTAPAARWSSVRHQGRAHEVRAAQQVDVCRTLAGTRITAVALKRTEAGHQHAAVGSPAIVARPFRRAGHHARRRLGSIWRVDVLFAMRGCGVMPILDTEPSASICAREEHAMAQTVASVVVLQDDHVLLMRSEQIGTWMLPGGIVEPGESVAQQRGARCGRRPASMCSLCASSGSTRVRAGVMATT